MLGQHAKHKARQRALLLKVVIRVGAEQFIDLSAALSTLLASLAGAAAAAASTRAAKRRPTASVPHVQFECDKS